MLLMTLLATAAVKLIKWPDMQQIFTVNMAEIQEIDTVTGIPMFMLAAVGKDSDLELVFRLLKDFPPALMI